MFRRLGTTDLSRWLKTPSWTTQILVTVGLLLLVAGVRRVIDIYAPGIAPFSLLFPAVLAATLTAGWASGLAVMSLGGIYAWLTVMGPQGANGARTPAEVLSLILYFACAGGIVAFAQAHRVITRRLLEEQGRVRLAVEAGRMAVWSADAANGIAPSPELKRLLGFAADAPLTLADLGALYLPGERERLREVAGQAVASGERFFEIEFRMRRLDGEVRWLLMRAELRLDAEGGISTVTGVVMDISDRKESEERLKLLAREVDHRANNLMAVVQSTVRLSQAPTVEGLKAVLIGRVAALARAHQLLSEARWEGADLRRLVAEELAAYSLGDSGRVEMAGPQVSLGPAAAQGLAMALHELATNAAKYGALSTPGGTVTVSWTREPQGPLALQWTEAGGPEVTAPTRRGLGTTMLSRALAGALGGSCKMEWRSEGLACTLSLANDGVERRATGV